MGITDAKGDVRSFLSKALYIGKILLLSYSSGSSLAPEHHQ